MKNHSLPLSDNSRLFAAPASLLCVCVCVFPPFHCVKLGYAELKTLHWEVTHIVVCVFVCVCVCVLCVTHVLNRNVTPCDCVTPLVAASLTTVGQLPLTGDKVFQLICSERI